LGPVPRGFEPPDFCPGTDPPILLTNPPCTVIPVPFRPGFVPWPQFCFAPPPPVGKKGNLPHRFASQPVVFHSLDFPPPRWNLVVFSPPFQAPSRGVVYFKNQSFVLGFVVFVWGLAFPPLCCRVFPQGRFLSFDSFSEKPPFSDSFYPMPKGLCFQKPPRPPYPLLEVFFGPAWAHTPSVPPPPFKNSCSQYLPLRPFSPHVNTPRLAPPFPAFSRFSCPPFVPIPFFFNLFSRFINRFVPPRYIVCPSKTLHLACTLPPRLLLIFHVGGTLTQNSPHFPIYGTCWVFGNFPQKFFHFHFRLPDPNPHFVTKKNTPPPKPFPDSFFPVPAHPFWKSSKTKTAHRSIHCFAVLGHLFFVYCKPPPWVSLFPVFGLTFAWCAVLFPPPPPTQITPFGEAFFRGGSFIFTTPPHAPLLLE